MGNLGIGEIAVIAIFGLLIFGPHRLPEIARSVGGFIREFKNVTNSVTNELKMELDDKPRPARAESAATSIQPEAPETGASPAQAQISGTDPSQSSPLTH
ncbi:MAG: Sec-independent protein translocase subunit TatA/TatB [Actinomycetota bacterium]